jgi:hypothetical protein
MATVAVGSGTVVGVGVLGDSVGVIFVKVDPLPVVTVGDAIPVSVPDGWPAVESPQPITTSKIPIKQKRVNMKPTPNSTRIY